MITCQQPKASITRLQQGGPSCCGNFTSRDLWINTKRNLSRLIEKRSHLFQRILKIFPVDFVQKKPIT